MQVETGSQSLACNLLRTKYSRDASFEYVEPKPNTSSFWRGVLKCRDVIKLGRRWLIGDETYVNFWLDIWVGNEPLLQSALVDGVDTSFLFPSRGIDEILSFGQEKAKVCDLVNWSAQFAMTLWLIWKSRNALIFQQQVDKLSKVWFMARKLAREHPSISASTGGLIRGSDGEWLAGFLVNIGTLDSLVAELWGLREGLLLAKQRRLWPLVVELDASMIVHMVKNGVPDSHPCSVLVADVMALIAEGWTMKFVIYTRKKNKCADYLANLAQTTTLGTTLLDEPPTILVPLLDKDISGPPTVRI
ncbi:hypothetical protein CCACVL1_14470 [Corchorus capsularis]|uniref:RNase H type-1 domain-containing protein n=1 Tax=Corchorus capsularis TaxID=210143 RepID=A0A1R3I717_COCAP|nr:hypothetical protein CCACVL1_14470 [Corchorus capsularis]